MIKAIIFDCFGVLTSSAWKEFWSSLPTTTIQDRARELNRAYDGGLITEEEFFGQLHELTKRPISEIRKILFDKDPVKNTELINYIRTLRPQYKTAILSNIATTWIEDYLLSDEEKELFDDMIISFQVGLTKPDPNIFKLTVKRLRVKPSECVFIDDIDHYCAAARAVGMQAIVYEDFKQMKRELEQILHKKK
ncbi:MAG TPA: HAD family phosphatase [Candidatus Saccharimonadales bacterium]|nr:HAD family phosphatase [Candidatus Saccharimonadales bacterium]